MRNLTYLLVLLVAVLLLIAFPREIDAQTCEATGGTYGIIPPPGKCNSTTGCCVPGQFYPAYSCSPPVTRNTKATLTLRSFGKGSNPTQCDQRHHSNHKLVVAMSTGWLYERGVNDRRCDHYIKIKGNGQSVKAKVVDECDSMVGCDALNDYKPPCHNNIIGASKAVWKALGVPENKWGELAITWSDA